MIKQYEVTPMAFPFTRLPIEYSEPPLQCPMCHEYYSNRLQGQYVKVIGILRLCVWTCSPECAELYIWATI